MYGHNFCRAGQQAFRMLASNALRVAAINSVGDFVLLLGKALVVMATVLIGVEMLQVSCITGWNYFASFIMILHFPLPVAGQGRYSTCMGPVGSGGTLCFLGLSLLPYSL